MEQVQTLYRLTGRSAPGRNPDFTPSHLLYTLDLVRKQRLGRKQISELIRVGEGTIRTILTRLSDEGLISVSRPGVSLSNEGVIFLDSLRKKLSWGYFPSSELTVADFNLYVLVRDASRKVRYGIEQRDQALIHGAVGATTLLHENNQWVLPGTRENAEVNVELDASDGDVLVIGTGNDEFSACLGAFSAALNLVR